MILRHTAEAMKVGYSKVLINEFVIPNRGASSFMTYVDINMMSIMAAKERTEQQWYDLLEVCRPQDSQDLAVGGGFRVHH